MLPRRLALLLPNALTLIGLVLGLAGALALQRGEVAGAASLLVGGQVADVLDGVAARRFNASTAAGALFDWHADCAVAAAVAFAAGVAWAIPVFVLVQAWARVHDERVSGRTAAMLGVVGLALGAW
ncbi:CDP-alcohol phosphatidyltransferase family protein [Nannocystis bainbridge]|uniref:CDP-alcohol phosphatidyltransferase family protein n=1 Tax=Nannocystis bainbridge TaxID=2995303 RepID=A0ABT5E6Y9_9BACT|nr:CDP-alcohol phosphatidyltransferase family protein [Nannocystis bainbridge]MDC0720678.1 CDP-alcohol phosphatidyltransferase family protein [Nannocystis bainbridge]